MGAFKRRPHNPAFEVIYVYSQKEGTLDLNFRGANKAVEPLQGMFATEILKLAELPPDPSDERVYDLNPLRERGFQFIYGPESGIQSVAVKKTQAFLEGCPRGTASPWKRMPPQDVRPSTTCWMRWASRCGCATYNVTQVELAALVAMKPDEKPKSVTVRITYPNSCSLKYDDVDLKLRQMLVDSGIEPREPTESMELGEAEAAEA